MRLFCVPYAGGGATTFHSWRGLLGSHGIDLCCIQLPGRETRFGDQLITTMEELVAQMCDGLNPYLEGRFSFFGYSMGALVSFEAIRELARRGQILPEWLLISAATPPHRRDVESVHLLPGADFIETVARRYNGLPPDVLENQELLDVVIPILRADFELTERYRYTPDKPLPVKIAAFGGRHDETVDPAELMFWRELTALPDHFRLTLFDGDHFFLNDQGQQLLAAIASLLTQSNRRSP